MRHPWWLEAGCLGLDTDLFFPGDKARDAAYAVAVRVCRGCSVRQECLEDALKAEQGPASRWGVRGGLTPVERNRAAHADAGGPE